MEIWSEKPKDTMHNQLVEQVLAEFFARQRHDPDSYPEIGLQPVNIIAIFSKSGGGKTTTINGLREVFPNFSFVSGGDFQRKNNPGQPIDVVVERLLANPKEGTDTATEILLMRAILMVLMKEIEGACIEARLVHMLARAVKVRVMCVRLKCRLEVRAERRFRQDHPKDDSLMLMTVRRSLDIRDQNDISRFAGLYPGSEKWLDETTPVDLEIDTEKTPPQEVVRKIVDKHRIWHRQMFSKDERVVIGA
jgi:cytidylate kinase